MIDPNDRKNEITYKLTDPAREGFVDQIKDWHQTQRVIKYTFDDKNRLTDVEMPKMDGFALTEAIRAQPKLANISVLILTSLTDENDRQRGLDAGADGYIVKSAFDEAALLSAVDRLLGRRTTP